VSAAKPCPGHERCSYESSRVVCWILAYLGQNASSAKRDKAKEENVGDREIMKSCGINRNKQEQTVDMYLRMRERYNLTWS
jgi:hypothetical protein